MIEYNVEQGSQDWFELRLGRPTASEFHKIITAVKMDYSEQADDYIDQIIGTKFNAMDGRFPPWVENYTNKSIRNGQQMEAEARYWYAMASGNKVRQVGFCTTDDGRFGASPDSLIGQEGGLELKCPEPHTHMSRLHRRCPDKKCKTPMDRKPGKDDLAWVFECPACKKTACALPHEYKAQVHGGLIVSGYKWWDFVSYCHGCPQFWVRVYPDEFTAKLAQHLERFWEEYQQTLERLKVLS